MKSTHLGYVFALLSVTLIVVPYGLIAQSTPTTVPLETRIENNNLYINSCNTNLAPGIGYKGYVDGVEIFSTGDFGGFPCYSGDLFINNLSSFYSANTTQPFVSNFDFYQNSSFSSPVTRTFQLNFDGTSFSLPNNLSGNSSVLFIPGLQASRLYEGTVLNCSLNCEDQLWEPNANSDVEDLYLDESGNSIRSNIYTRDIILETNTPTPDRKSVV